jgi:hypothetical protein
MIIWESGKENKRVEIADIGEKALQVITFLYTPNLVCVERLFTRPPSPAAYWAMPCQSPESDSCHQDLGAKLIE